MKHHVAVIAQVRPGKRDELARVLEQGPPFDLAEHGFTRHQAFLGDSAVVLVFEGDRAVAHVHELAAGLPIAQMMRLGTLVSKPQVLSDSWTWEPAATSAASRA